MTGVEEDQLRVMMALRKWWEVRSKESPLKGEPPNMFINLNIEK